LIARLFDSVAPEVKTISRSSAPISRATWWRAASTAAATSLPWEWLVEWGLPNFSVK
jgi:hypothetical protein